MKTKICLSAMVFFVITSCGGLIDIEDPIPKDSILQDIDGNVYKTVIIGDQTWMAENLKTTKFNDGTSILYETNKQWWSIMRSPAYCYYDNDMNTYKDIYGALYNWYAVNTGKLCPVGWHVPTNKEWDVLTSYLGDNAGNKLKIVSDDYWLYGNETATNESGFSALPGGARGMNGQFGDINALGFWWSSTEYSESFEPLQEEYKAWYRAVHKNWATLFRQEQKDYYFYKVAGFSIRCIKD